MANENFTALNCRICCTGANAGVSPGGFIGKRNNQRDDFPVPEQEASRHSFEDRSPEVDYLVRLSLSEKTVNMAERDLGVHSPIVGSSARMGEQNHVGKLTESTRGRQGFLPVDVQARHGDFSSFEGAYHRIFVNQAATAPH